MNLADFTSFSRSHFLAVSHSYGYGLLDASAMVALAQNWTSVGPQHKCVIDMVTEPRYKRSKKRTYIEGAAHRVYLPVSVVPDTLITAER